MFLKNFVFFYVKKTNLESDLVLHEHHHENINYFISSIKKHHPESKIIQCTDLQTDIIQGVDKVFRVNVNQNKIMASRIFCYSKLNLDNSY